MPPAAAAATSGMMATEVEEFRAWKAASLAAAALSLDEESGSDWEGDGFEFGAVALPEGGEMGWRNTTLYELGAVATRPRAEGAPLAQVGPRTKGPTKRKSKAGNRPRQVVGPAVAQPVGTAALEQKMSLEATQRLRTRRDRAALKERMAKLPDQGREVAAQGLHKLPQGFQVRTSKPQKSAELLVGHEACADRLPAISGRQPSVGVERQPFPAGGSSQGHVLGGQVSVNVRAFLELAERAGLSLSQVVAMTRGSSTEMQPLPEEVDPRVVVERAVQAAGVSQRGAVVQRERRVGVEAEGGGAAASAGQAKLAGRTQEAPTMEAPASPARSAVLNVSTDPESSWMPAARARQQKAAAEESADEAADEQLALKLLEEDAAATGMDPAAALKAQATEGKEALPDRGWEKVSKRSKGKQKMPEYLTDEERALGAGAWRPAWGETQALAAFAEARPKVTPGDRSKYEGTPDWVDNTAGAVRVMTVSGLKAPHRVLIDGGSLYSMVGSKLAAQLGLPVDRTGDDCWVQTALGRIEQLGHGFTRSPVPIVLNKGTPAELTLYERLAVTNSTGYDLLIGMRAAYPVGLSVDRWEERATYRVDWQTGGEHVGNLPMKLKQVGGAGAEGAKEAHRQVTAGVVLACSAVV